MKQKITPRICLPHRRRETSEALGLSKPCRRSFFRLRCGMSAEQLRSDVEVVAAHQACKELQSSYPTFKQERMTGSLGWCFLAGL